MDYDLRIQGYFERLAAAHPDILHRPGEKKSKRFFVNHADGIDAVSSTKDPVMYYVHELGTYADNGMGTIQERMRVRIQILQHYDDSKGRARQEEIYHQCKTILEQIISKMKADQQARKLCLGDAQWRPVLTSTEYQRITMALEREVYGYSLLFPIEFARTFNDTVAWKDVDHLFTTAQ